MRAMLGCIDTLGSYTSFYKRYGTFATDHSISRNIRRLNLSTCHPAQLQTIQTLMKRRMVALRRQNPTIILSTSLDKVSSGKAFQSTVRTLIVTPLCQPVRPIVNRAWSLHRYSEGGLEMRYTK